MKWRKEYTESNRLRLIGSSIPIQEVPPFFFDRKRKRNETFQNVILYCVVIESCAVSDCWGVYRLSIDRWQMIFCSPFLFLLPERLVEEAVIMGMLSEESMEFLERCRRSRRLVLIIVAIALLLDNMLLTTVGNAKSNCLCSSSHCDYRRRNGSINGVACRGSLSEDWQTNKLIEC